MRAALALPFVLVGCATPDEGPPPTEPTYDPIAAFAPLDLPAPNGVRGADGAPGPDYWQQRVDYSIDARLDVPHRVLHGRATVTYHNASPHTLDYLWLSLEQEAFRDDGLAEVMSPAWPPPFEEGVDPGYDLLVESTSGRDLDTARYETLARVDLLEPLAPGASLEFRMLWSFPIMTEDAIRHGVEEVGDGLIFQLAQWFPALCVYDDVHGWNALPFLRTGEFYTNFGTYDVRLTVPREYLVTATGVLQNPDEVLVPALQERLAAAGETANTVSIVGADEVGDPALRPEGDGPLTWRFLAEDVRTFAWAASDAFLWEASTSGGGVLCQSFFPREGLPAWSDATEMLRWSVDHYSRQWTPYPYPHATNVNGPEYGMEYPMVFFSGSRGPEYDLFSVTTHELVHNWFPMVVNTDERRHAWMDEGFNTLWNVLAVRERYPGVDFYAELPDFLEDRDEFADMLRFGEGVPMERGHDLLPDWLSGYLAYDKPGMALLLLREEILGPERFDAAFRDYVRRWSFKAPRPADFFRCMEDAAGADLAWFWRGWFLEAPVLDAAVTDVLYEDGEATVDLRLLGGMPMPVPYRVTYADGRTEDRRVPALAWSRGDRASDTWATASRPVRVELDADRDLPDVDRTNDVWPLAPPES